MKVGYDALAREYAQHRQVQHTFGLLRLWAQGASGGAECR